MIFEPSSDCQDRAGGPAEGWWTWSRDVCDLLRALTELGKSLPSPVLTNIGLAEYAYTLDAPKGFILPLDLQAATENFAAALHLTTSSSLRLLTGLLPSGVSAHALRLLLAASRSYIARLTGDPYSAIFAPLGVVGRTRQMHFALHADLYPSVFLLNIFDNVPSDSSGKSLFLPAVRFVEIIDSIQCIPPDIRAIMVRCLDLPLQEDRYQYFFDLLHGSHPWTEEVEVRMQEQTYAIKLFHGEGYLMNDRRWLHGRTAPSGGVPSNRLYRLVFDSKETLAIRRSSRPHLLTTCLPM